jgi:methanogenic corrinoid protein MtbC1
MRLVTRLTGLSPDTIRAWERRYRAIEPGRTSGNTRQFSAEDVRRLTLLKELTDLGHAISAVASLDTPGLETLVGKGHGRPASPPPVPEVGKVVPMVRLAEAYLMAVARFDTRRSFALLRNAAQQLDPSEFLFTVAVPVIQEVGQRWSHGELGVAQEHIVSAQLSALLATLERPVPPEGAPRILMVTPPGHRHELGLLVAAVLAAHRGFDVVYLGADLPWAELDWAVQMSRPQMLVLSVVRDLTPSERAQLDDAVVHLAEKVPVWLGCPVDHGLTRARLPIHLFHAYAQFDAALQELAR